MEKCQDDVTFALQEHLMSSEILNILTDWSPAHSGEHKDRAAILSRSEVSS